MPKGSRADGQKRIRGIDWTRSTKVERRGGAGSRSCRIDERGIPWVHIPRQVMHHLIYCLVVDELGATVPVPGLPNIASLGSRAYDASQAWANQRTKTGTGHIRASRDRPGVNVQIRCEEDARNFARVGLFYKHYYSVMARVLINQSNRYHQADKESLICFVNNLDDAAAELRVPNWTDTKGAIEARAQADVAVQSCALRIPVSIAQESFLGVGRERFWSKINARTDYAPEARGPVVGFAWADIPLISATCNNRLKGPTARRLRPDQDTLDYEGEERRRHAERLFPYLAAKRKHDDPWRLLRTDAEQLLAAKRAIEVNPVEVLFDPEDTEIEPRAEELGQPQADMPDASKVKERPGEVAIRLPSEVIARVTLADDKETHRFGAVFKSIEEQLPSGGNRNVQYRLPFGEAMTLLVWVGEVLGEPLGRQRRAWTKLHTVLDNKVGSEPVIPPGFEDFFAVRETLDAMEDAYGDG